MFVNVLACSLISLRINFRQKTLSIPCPICLNKCVFETLNHNMTALFSRDLAGFVTALQSWRIMTTCAELHLLNHDPSYAIYSMCFTQVVKLLRNTQYSFENKLCNQMYPIQRIEMLRKHCPIPEANRKLVAFAMQVQLQLSSLVTD